MTSPAPLPPVAARLVLGRYALDSPLPYDLPGGRAFSAHDTILFRPVHVYLLDAAERVPAVLEGAGRAALVTGMSFQKIVRMGEDEGAAAIVCEPLPGETLRRLAPLTPDGAGWLMQQASEALETARARGLGHGMLRPEAIAIGPDGRIVITGLGWEAELVRLPAGDAQERAARDARGLMELYCYALVGQPFHVQRCELDPHPTAQPYLPGETLWDRFPPHMRGIAFATLAAQDGAAVSPAAVLQALTTPLRDSLPLPALVPAVVPAVVPAPVSDAAESGAGVHGAGVHGAGATSAAIPDTATGVGNDGAPSVDLVRPPSESEREVLHRSAVPAEQVSSSGAKEASGPHAAPAMSAVPERPASGPIRRPLRDAIDPAVPTMPVVAPPPAGLASVWVAPSDVTEELPAITVPGPVTKDAAPPAPITSTASTPPAPSPDPTLPAGGAPAAGSGPEEDADLTEHGDKRGRWWLVDSSITELFPTREDS